MRVGIATDHGGFGLKEELLTRLRVRRPRNRGFRRTHVECRRRLSRLRRASRGGRRCWRGAARRGDLRQRCWRVGLRQQGRRYPGGARPRPFLRAAGRRGRSPQHPLHGRTDGRAGRRLGSRPGVPRRRVQSGRRGICGDWRKSSAWNRRRGASPLASTMALSAPQARPPERSGVSGPRERRRWGAGGAKAPRLITAPRAAGAPAGAEWGIGAPRATAMGGPAGRKPPG